VTTDRNAVSAQYTILITQKQDISTAKNSYTTYKIAYDKAVNDLSIAKLQAEANIKIYKAALDQATANYNNKANPPREVDVASYRAALSQAIANRNKAVLVAPMDGQVIKINKKVGEYISASESMIEMTAPHYEIDVDIPETDIVKIALNDKAIYTLGSIGDNEKFVGIVEKIDSKSTLIQDVVYYRVRIRVEDKYLVSHNFKPGMTANVSIETANGESYKSVLTLPLRSVLTEADGSKYVRLLINNQVTTTTVEIGSRVDGGQVIVKSGVSEGDEVVLSVK